ncbi:haloacid dehalogenase type II, partial [Streptomyces sp. NPDC058834]
MPELEIDAVVFDVLGTLVDEPGGIRAGIRALAPSLDASGVEQLLSLWQRHVDREQRRVVAGARPYLTSDLLDLEAAPRRAPPPRGGGPARRGAPGRGPRQRRP